MRDAHGVRQVDDPEHRSEQQRVEHRVDVHALAVQRRHERAVGEREREPLVEQLVGHHGPVGDT